jgi:geranylgeranyl pyrophosphate synthase
VKRPWYTHLIGESLARVEALLRSPMPGQNPRVTQAVNRLIESGGKRIRPVLTLLSSHLCQADLDQAVYVAAGIEILHTATLIHDDLIDGALMRRGVPTLNSYLPPRATILIGDSLFARSAALVNETGHIPMVRAFADTLAAICSGETQQLFSQQSPRARVTRAAYDQRVISKTASLFALCSKASAILTGASEKTTAALHQYGEHLGMAFQIVDDVLDIAGDPDELGKSIGGDLRHGLVTLPTLYFLEAHPDHADVTALLAQHRPGETSQQDDNAVQAAIAALRSSDALERALQDARQLAQAAQITLSGFPPSPYRDAMSELAGLVVERSF